MSFSIKTCCKLIVLGDLIGANGLLLENDGVSVQAFAPRRFVDFDTHSPGRAEPSDMIYICCLQAGWLRRRQQVLETRCFPRFEPGRVRIGHVFRDDALAFRKPGQSLGGKIEKR